MDKIKIGVVGCGNISTTYFMNLAKFRNLEVTACADLLLERAQDSAKAYHIPRACTTADLLADPQIRIVVNLTIPGVHASLNQEILSAGKNAYVEKPLALSLQQASPMLALAKSKKLLVGCAPDTFMGAGIQTCRKIIDDGWIGRPVAATAFMMCAGHESWHPDPEFFYASGGGPLFDMGPYYITALVSLLGPVKNVCGMAKTTFPERVITSEKKYGNKIQVQVPTHTTGLLEFENGTLGTLIMSFDVVAHKMPFIEIYGSRGTLRVPDPNKFGGMPEIKMGGTEWCELPLTHAFAENSRGLGVSDMAQAVANSKKDFRASSDLAFHILEVMESLHVSSDQGARVAIQNTCTRPTAMPRLRAALEPQWMDFDEKGKML